MSLKIKTAARLKALFAGVALSKKTIELIGDQMSKAGLTDESTDEEIDAKLNDRNALYSFEDQKKFDDYQTGKVAKEKADKEAADKKAAEEGKTPPTNPEDAEMPAWAKALIQSNQTLAQSLEAIKGEKVTNTRKEQLAEKLANTPDAFKNKAIKDFNRMKFETDDEFNDYLTETETDAADFIQEQSNAGLGGDRPPAGFGKKTGEKEVSPEMKQYQADRAAERAKTTV
jgi:hypothetical protein